MEFILCAPNQFYVLNTGKHYYVLTVTHNTIPTINHGMSTNVESILFGSTNIKRLDKKSTDNNNNNKKCMGNQFWQNWLEMEIEKKKRIYR